MLKVIQVEHQKLPVQMLHRHFLANDFHHKLNFCTMRKIIILKNFFRTVIYSVLLSSNLLASFAQAQQFNCTNLPLIEIKTPDNGMIKDICVASRDAISFLSVYKLHPKRVIRTQIIENAINNDGYLAYGSYHRQNDLILLTSLSSILKSASSPQMYEQPFDMEHYHGAIAHEIAHAIFQHNTKNIKEQLTNATQEYLAHSTQLGILSKERREKIIKASNVGPWEPGDSISVTYMGLNPTGSAVKSYLHLSQMEDPQPFIKFLLDNNWFFISVP